VIELTSILLIIMAIGITVTSIEYYKQISKAKKEYDKAKGIIEDIVLSFNRELKREANRLEIITYKVDANLAKSDNSIERIKNIEKIVVPIKEKINKINEITSTFLSTTSTIENRIQNFDDSNQKINNRIEKLEEKMTSLTELPEIIRETVIPIRREKALGAITDTEIKVLEVLSFEGGKTAPEMKNKINLSREHTARLMKKLYEKGYLERETRKIPFKYSVKKEMEKFLTNSKDNQT